MENETNLDGLRLAISARGLLGLAQTLDQVNVGRRHAAGKHAASARVEQLQQLGLGEIEQLRHLETAEKVAAERATTGVLVGIFGSVSLRRARGDSDRRQCIERRRTHGKGDKERYND